MSQLATYQQFKASVLANGGKIVGDGQCVSLVVNNSQAYVEALFPGVSWPMIIPPVVSAKQMAGKSNSYLQWVENDHNNPNQLPPVGAIMIFGATGPDGTPGVLPGYSNKYNNPDGHTGINDGADSSGYNLLQQNSPSFGSPANITRYTWKFRPCLGWYIPLTTTPPPSPTPAPQGQTITLPATTGPWHLYKPGGPYNYLNPANVKGLIVPSQFGGLTYPIDKNVGNGVYRITSEDYGQGDLWTNGSYVIIK